MMITTMTLHRPRQECELWDWKLFSSQFTLRGWLIRLSQAMSMMIPACNVRTNICVEKRWEPSAAPSHTLQWQHGRVPCTNVSFWKHFRTWESERPRQPTCGDDCYLQCIIKLKTDYGKRTIAITAARRSVRLSDRDKAIAPTTPTNCYLKS